MDDTNNQSDYESDSDAAYVGDDADEVIDITPRNDDDAAADDFDDMDMVDDFDAEQGMTEEEEEVRFIPEQDDASIVFTKHTDSVLSVCIDAHTCSLAVTGGVDDTAFVWRLSTGEVLFECTGHKESVNCVGFSCDSSMVATGDMNGLIKVWSVETGKELWSEEATELEWLRWHKTASAVLLAGTVDGNVWLFNISSQSVKTIPGTGSKCTVGEFMPDGRRACVGYDDGTVKVWDLKSSVALQTFTAASQGHQSTVICLSCHHDNRLVLTGSTDFSSLLLNTDNGKRLNRFDCKTSNPGETAVPGEEVDRDDSVEAVGFSLSSNYSATGTNSGMLTIWDTRTQTQRHQFQHKMGIVKLEWDPVDPIVYTCSLDGCLYSWNVRDLAPLRQYQGHSMKILDMALSSNGATIVTAGDDHTARVFNVRTST